MATTRATCTGLDVVNLGRPDSGPSMSTTPSIARNSASVVDPTIARTPLPHARLAIRQVPTRIIMMPIIVMNHDPVAGVSSCTYKRAPD